MVKNKYCDKSNLRNESDVEQFFIAELLKEMGYTPDYIETKPTIPELQIGKGKTKKRYTPDYILYKDKAHTKPILVIDAKSPDENSEEGVLEAQLYTSVIRRKLKDPKPEQYCIGTNGITFIVKHYDSDNELLELKFEDFVDGNLLYDGLKKSLSFESLSAMKSGLVDDFEFKKPPIPELKKIFRECHNLIWSAETGSPTFAFYEFIKIMFIKLDEDKKLLKNKELREKIISGLPIPSKDVVFSVRWIEHQEKTDNNPVNNILFKNLRKALEKAIYEGDKKRIFDENEQIRLSASTTKSIVKMLEHHNLFGIEEDLNGRMFETFLTATMRGKALGQFFTPRSVVELMSHMANLKVSSKDMENVIDACCGTGGFLIEAMTIMRDKILKNPSLTNEDKEKMLHTLVYEKLYGIDAGKDPPIARIARINMYLHDDGGSRIYFADSLNKKMPVEDDTEQELKRDLNELKRQLKTNELKFNVALTNPPFAVPYKKTDEKKREVLEQYEISYREGTKELYPTSRSNILFLERYRDLLDDTGRLLTIIDDTPLNGAGESARAYRRFIKKYFIIKAIISLPMNTFVNAGTNPKVSVLYLKKKRKEDETQPAIFMAISKSVGHDSAGRETDDSDLKLILNRFKDFEDTGKFSPVLSDTQIFLVEPENLVDELNPYIYCPELHKIKSNLKQLEKKGKITLVEGKNMPLVADITKDEAEKIKYEVFKYFALRDISKDGTIASYKTLEFADLPQRAKKRVRAYDVVMSRNAGSLGKIAIIPDWLNMQFCSDGFLVFRMGSKEKALLLASILRTDLVQKQMFYAQRESTQPDIKEKTFKARVSIPFPTDKKVIDEIVGRADSAESFRNKIKSMQDANWEAFNEYAEWKPISKIEYEENGSDEPEEE